MWYWRPVSGLSITCPAISSWPPRATGTWIDLVVRVVAVEECRLMTQNAIAIVPPDGTVRSMARP